MIDMVSSMESCLSDWDTLLHMQDHEWDISSNVLVDTFLKTIFMTTISSWRHNFQTETC